MKYIEVPELSRLTKALTHEGPECSVHTRIEAYSCKNIKRDKKLFRALENAYNDEVSNSPPLPSFMALDREPDISPFGPMQEHHSRKTLYLLIATLNVAFPDHEFSDVRPQHFNREESGASVLNALSTTLVSPHRAGMQAPRTYSSYPPASADLFPSSVPTSSSPYEYTKPSPHAPSKVVSSTHPTFYRILDEVIGLPECEVYSYAPDVEFDPHADDYEDDEDDVASVGDEMSSSEDDVMTFEFDDYDVDEIPHRPATTSSKWRLRQPQPHPHRSSSPSISSPPPLRGRTSSSEDSDEWPWPSSSPVHIRMKRRGALLWSSHWFFLNRKLKRILFISVWARARSVRPWSGLSDAEEAYGYEYASSPERVKGERFKGWEGAEGAGARALGLSATA